MQQFGTAEVARLTRIPVGAIRTMVRARYVSPARSQRGALRFSFRDLVLLRTARQLLAAGLSRRRVGQALRSLRSQLPEELPTGGLSVSATGGRVVVHEAGEQRDALTGQMLLAFEVRADGADIQLIDASPATATDDAASKCEQDFAAALQLEDTDIQAATEAYQACVARHSHSGARANLGRLLHLQGRISEALTIYGGGDQSSPDLLYNQAVALEDLGQIDAAVMAYTRVLELDRDYVDAHHNLARLLQQTGDHRRALRHWNAYRRLANG